MEQELQELKKRVENLQKENSNLQKKITRLEQRNDSEQQQEKKQNKKIEKLFEVYEKRRYALKLAYIGINYLGIEHQKTTNNTVEYHLFNAFKKTCLVQSIENMNDVGYSRSGRTDKGVSALGNVVSLDLRTSIKKNQVQQQTDKQEEQDIIEQQEQNNTMDYVKMLNGVLPDDIRVLAAAEVHKDFNSRFECDYRVYKYFFIKNNMDVEKIEEAAKLLQGEHDFRNYCKIDVVQTTNYIRTILDTHIEIIQKNELDSQLDMYVITIKGTAFLWHQIRCIMSILFLVGDGKEQPSIVTELFDVQKYAGRPQYQIASDLPLILYECAYKDVDFVYNQQNAFKIYSHFKKILVEKMIEGQLYSTSMQYLLNVSAFQDDNQNQLNSDFKLMEYIKQQGEENELSKKYQPISQRPLCDNPSEAISKLKGKRLQLFNDKLEKKRKLNNEQIDDDNNE